MFNNVVLDVFIGLIFIYLLYSLLSTILMELIARWFNMRSRMLMKAIRRMLEDNVSPKGNWFQKSTFYNYIAELFNGIGRFFTPMKEKEKVVRLFYDQPSIKYLGEDKAFSKPSYIRQHNFSNTLIQMLRGDSYDGSTSNESTLIKDALNNNILNINKETLSYLQNLFADAKQDVNQFRIRLELWFDETMERANGWYKRQTQIILIIIGFFLAWQFNVDSIAITKILLKDKKVREQMVELAISKKDSYGQIADTVHVITARTTKKLATDSSQTVIDSTVYKSDGKYLDTVYKSLSEDASSAQSLLGLGSKESPNSQKYQKSTVLKIIGWLLTAFAISLGAPFWFDLLNKVIKLRSSGTRPATAAENSSTTVNPTEKTANGKIIRG